MADDSPPACDNCGKRDQVQWAPAWQVHLCEACRETFTFYAHLDRLSLKRK